MFDFDDFLLEDINYEFEDDFLNESFDMYDDDFLNESSEFIFEDDLFEDDILPTPNDVMGTSGWTADEESPLDDAGREVIKKELTNAPEEVAEVLSLI